MNVPKYIIKVTWDLEEQLLEFSKELLRKRDDYQDSPELTQEEWQEQTKENL